MGTNKRNLFQNESSKRIVRRIESKSQDSTCGLIPKNEVSAPAAKEIGMINTKLLIFRTFC